MNRHTSAAPPATAPGRRLVAALLGAGLAVGTASPALAAPPPPDFAFEQVSGLGPDQGQNVYPALAQISSDGTRVLYSGHAGEIGNSLLVRERVTGTTAQVEQLTPGDFRHIAEDRALSADGQHVVFLRQPPEGGARALFLADAAGTTLREVPLPAELSGDSREVELSADGRTATVLVWPDLSRGEERPVTRLLPLDLTTGAVPTPVDLPWVDVTRLVVSDDASHAALVAATDEGPVLQVLDLATGEVAESFPDWGGQDPALDGDGSTLAYRTTENALAVVDLTAGTRTEVPLPDDVVPYTPALSADGGTVAFGTASIGEGSRAADAPRVFLAPSHGGTPVLVAGGGDEGNPMGVEAALPVLSADGRTVVLWQDGRLVAATPAANGDDRDAPQWPADAALTAEPTQDGEVRLSWPAATDRALAGYDLTVDGEPLASVGADTRSWNAPGDAAEHTYAVTARDVAGNRGTALVATATGYAGLAVETAGAGLLLRIPVAGDGATGLRVLRAPLGQDADRPAPDAGALQQVAELAAGTTEWTDTGLDQLAWYAYRVDRVAADGTSRPLTSIAVAHTAAPAPGLPQIGAVTSTGATLTWPDADPSLPLAGYRLERRQTAPNATEWTVVARGAAVTATDRGLTPGHRYAWRVVAELEGGWAELPWTTEAETVLQLQGVTDLQVGVTRTAGGQALVLGSSLTVSARDETGMTGSVRLTGRLGEQAVTVDLPLTEVEPGRYATSPYLLDGRGITRIDSLVVSLTDGTRTDTERVRDLGAIGGRLTVTVAPGVDLTGAVLRFPGGSQPMTAPGTVALDVPSGPVDVDLLLPDGDIVAAQRVQVPSAGTPSTTLTPVRHSELHVTLSAAGGTVQPGSVTVTGPDGELLAGRSFPGGATEVVLPGLVAGTDVVVTARLADQTSRTTQPSAAVSLTGGRIDAALRQEPLPAADLAVSATGLGVPLTQGTVTVVQEVDGRTFTSTASIAGGSATVRGLAGPATARVEAPFHVASGGSLQLPGSLTLDLVREPTYRIRPHLLTTNIGSAPVEQPMDWITGSHFRLRFSAAGTGLLPGADVPFAGAPGDVVRLCGDGAEAGLSSGCVELVLGEDRDVDVTLSLEQKGAATARVVGTDGRPVAWWQAEVVRVGSDSDDMFRRSAGSQQGSGADARLSLPEVGRYEVSWTSEGSGSARSTFEVVDGTPAQLGTVTLAEDAWLADQPSVTPSVVLPGQTAVIRLVVPARNSENTVAWMNLDAGVSHVPGTALVDGAPVASTVVDGAVEIPLGATAATVRVPVQIAADAADGQRQARVSVRSGPADDGYVPTAYYEVQTARITGPGRVATPVVPVSGEAPAGSAVVVRDASGRTVGTATAGPGGRWSTQVQLYNPAPRREQRLIATVGEGAEASLSAPYTVTYDPQFVQPELITVTPTDALGQQTRREISFDPRQGVASMTMIYVPHERVRVSARFADASRVHGFTAYVGALSATGSCTATTCVAWLPAGSAAQTGDIWIDYDVDAVPTGSWADVPVGDEDARRNALPVDWRDPELVGRGTVGGAQVTTFTLPNGLEVTATVSAELVEAGALSAADQALQRATGIPGQGFSVTGTTRPDGVDIRMRGGLPVEWLEGGPDQRPAIAGGEKMLAFANILFQIKGNLSFQTDMLNMLFGGTDDDAALDELRRFVLDTHARCAPAQAQQMLGRIMQTRADLGYLRGTNTAMGALGLMGGEFALAFEKAGVNALSEVYQTALEAAVGDGYEQIITAMMAAEMQELNEYIRLAPRCDPRLDTLPLFWVPPSARPHWIYDPSGTVYEALASQPLAGVTATVFSGPSANGPWTVWDAAAYGQTNPQPTTATGYYGWDVPQGWWRVEYSAPGYRTQTSAPMQVLPEHYGVDADLHRLAAPALSSAAFTAAGALAVEFDQWMSVDSVRAGLSLRLGSTAVAGTLAASAAQRAPDGVLLARSFTFTPAGPLPSQAQVRLVVAGATVDHGDVALGTDAIRDLRAPARPDAPVACGQVGLTVNPTARVAPNAVVTATITAPAGAPVQVRAITVYSVVDWLRALLTGQGSGVRPSVVLAEGRTDARGRVVLTFRASRDALVFAQQTRCPGTSRLVVVDVR